VAPSLKVTVPVGFSAPDPPVTVAVKVTLAPTTAEETEEVKAVVVDAAATVTATVFEEEERLRVSPP